MAITKASSNAVAPAAKGDLVVGNATNDSGVLAVGSTDQVLTVDSSTATGLKWATPAGNKDLAQIASGSLSGTSVSLTGLTADFMMLEVKGAGFVTGAQGLAVTLNTAVTNYNYRGYVGTTSSGSGEAIIGDATTEIYPNKSQAANGSGGFYLTLQNCASAGFTTFQQSGTLLNSTYFGFNIAGYYNSETAITSIQIKGTGGGTFNAGTYRLIGA